MQMNHTGKTTSVQSGDATQAAKQSNKNAYPVTPVLAESKKFLNWLDPSETAFTFQTAGDTKDAKENVKPRWIHGTLNELLP
jgi:hypothetical protein